MAWNEPGNNDNDPWKNRGKDQGPPDLDELFKDLGKRFNGMFGGKPSGTGEAKKPSGSMGFILVLVVGFLIWVLSGIYTLKEAERGVVLTFGEYSSLEDPGIQFKWTFIQEVYPVNIQTVRTLPAAGFMLTKDENVVRVEMEVQYKVVNPRDFLFSTPNPENSLRQATDSALRMVIGHSRMDDILTSGREVVRQNTWRELEKVIEPYNLGLIIVDVNFKDARPPEEVKDAFDDAIAAQEDEVRYVNEAKAYESEVEPRARGQVNRMIQEATAYKQGKILASEGQVAKFEQLLPEYKAAPKVTKDRLYLETMEQVYSNTSKILVNTTGGGNMMYLPLDKIMQQQNNVKSDSNRENVNYNTGSGNTTQPTQSATGRNGRTDRSNDGRN
ncbi:FtsH protease activity modulator HflK [Psychrosphaera aquimarina]|uniref:Protein HflK n=1 Tax=Psychrosphaera aquimarina TaxID=2044854 RepID=A0ABU3R2G2_9GAMM|nr:FtsH protease activity modulator HflK [Psychrosphaera aquimarina]MDU0113729.1 FtsH protease activity modulator HflK [Psychrosphaera aquimarina]